MELNTKSRTEPLVEVKDLVKYYGDRLAVDNISFEVGRGEILGFLGPNGAGKTTTMRIITGYMPPTRGEVKVCGIDVLEKPVEAKRLIGYLPENPPVYSDMTVISYLKFVARLKRVPRNKIKERLDFVLEKCGLKDVKGRIIGNLSRGYRQRVGIAQAIIHDPQIMIFDEPTVGLDPQQVVEIRNLIKEISKDKTVILSTHILSEVTKICNRVIIISGGRLVFSEYLDRIGAIEGRRKFLFWFSNPTEAQTAYNTISDMGLKKIKDVKLEDSKISILSEDDIRKDLIKDLLSKSGVVPIKVDEEVPSLEEVYLKVVSGANPQE
jgi:ABC-type multidrug transport system, ATPase component